MGTDKKDWTSRIIENRRLYSKAATNNQMATAGMLDSFGTLTHDPKYQAWKKKLPVKKQYATTNAEEAKKLGCTRRQVSKLRNGKIKQVKTS